MYIAICKIDDQCNFNAGIGALKAGALGHPRGIGWGGGLRLGDTCTLVADSCRSMAKKHHNIIK